VERAWPGWTRTGERKTANEERITEARASAHNHTTTLPAAAETGNRNRIRSGSAGVARQILILVLILVVGLRTAREPELVLTFYASRFTLLCNRDQLCSPLSVFRYAFLVPAPFQNPEGWGMGSHAPRKKRET